MGAVTYQGPGQVEVREVDEPTLDEATDAIVDTELAGVCGSDLHIYHGDTGGVEPGITIGHELVGRVQAVGEQVTRVAEGDRVVAGFQVPCGEREASNGCPKLGIFGHGIALGSLNGAQAERVRVPNADLVLREVLAGVSNAQAVFASDTLCAAHTGVREHLTPGGDVVAVGAGPVGLLALEIAQALGSGRTHAVEVDPDRAETARERGNRAPIRSAPIPSRACRRLPRAPVPRSWSRRSATGGKRWIPRSSWSPRAGTSPRWACRSPTSSTTRGCRRSPRT